MIKACSCHGFEAALQISSEAAVQLQCHGTHHQDICIIVFNYLPTPLPPSMRFIKTFFFGLLVYTAHIGLFVDDYIY